MREIICRPRCIDTMLSCVCVFFCEGKGKVTNATAFTAPASVHWVVLKNEVEGMEALVNIAYDRISEDIILLYDAMRAYNEVPSVASRHKPS